MSPYSNQDSVGDYYQMPGRYTPVPESLRPGPQIQHAAQRGRRVSFASPAVQPNYRGNHAYSPQENDAPYRHHARSASMANTELHFDHSTPSYASPRPRSYQQPPPVPLKRPEFLIVGLFALRLAKKLIKSLDKYPERDADLTWINRFLSPYTRRDALAKISGARIDDYVTHYPDIVARFIKQPRFPVVFSQMNPDKRVTGRKLTDQECVDIVDFADAAGEWGSTVKLPGMEAERIERLAERRRMANF